MNKTFFIGYSDIFMSHCFYMNLWAKQYKIHPGVWQQNQSSIWKHKQQCIYVLNDRFMKSKPNNGIITRAQIQILFLYVLLTISIFTCKMSIKYHNMFSTSICHIIVEPLSNIIIYPFIYFIIFCVCYHNILCKINKA